MIKLLTISCVTFLWSTCYGIGVFRITESITSREIQNLPSLDDIVLSDPDLTTLAAAFQVAALTGRLCTRTGCNSTVFAPTNDAIDNFNPNFWKMLLTTSWILHLQNLLAFHATVPNDNRKRQSSIDLVDGQSFTMLNREIVKVRDMKRGISLFTELTDSSNLIELDIIATNGMLHKIDTILEPEFMGVDVFALGKRYQGFKILTGLLESIGLVGIRSEFTLIAPTDDAFLALGDDVLEELRKDKDKLRKLLTNHVIFGVNPSLFLIDGLVLPTLGGLTITFTISDDISNDSIVTLPEPKLDFVAAQQVPVKVNGANVLFLDVLASNGIAHVVDRVLFDPNLFSKPPSIAPSRAPEALKTTSPTNVPSMSPISIPSAVPSEAPSLSPDGNPSTAPTIVPSSSPESAPSASPTKIPSASPTATPSAVPSDSLVRAPRTVPMASPTAVPSGIPSRSPIRAPRTVPIARPTAVSSGAPSGSPIRAPVVIPVDVPIGFSMRAPIAIPVNVPSKSPTGSPIRAPVVTPINVPSEAPSVSPEVLFEATSLPPVPSVFPNRAPSSTSPTSVLSNSPSAVPSRVPSEVPSTVPSVFPTTPPI